MPDLNHMYTYEISMLNCPYLQLSTTKTTSLIVTLVSAILVDSIIMCQKDLAYVKRILHMLKVSGTCKQNLAYTKKILHTLNVRNKCGLMFWLSRENSSSILHRSRFIIFTYARFESHVYLWNLYVKLSLLAAVHNKDDIINSYTSFCYIVKEAELRTC
jgi:hypothetical protein